jgi:hypothetical protein
MNNVALPAHQYGFVRTEYCNNLKPGTEGFMPCVIFGAESVPGRALMFHILREDGALVAQVPIHALCHRMDAPSRNVTELAHWDCFGWNLTAISFDYLREAPVETRIGEQVMPGRYICTFDFLADGFSDAPDQHKCFHFIALDDGNYALRTNDKLKVLERSFVCNPFDWDDLPQIERNRLIWRVE